MYELSDAARRETQESIFAANDLIFSIIDLRFLRRRNFCQQCLLDVGERRVRSDGDFELQCFCVNIANIDAALVIEQDRVGRSVRVDTYVGFFGILVRNEWLDDEVAQLSVGIADLLIFAHSFADPLFDLLVVFVDRNQTQLAATLYQLIWFHNQGLKGERNERNIK